MPGALSHHHVLTSCILAAPAGAFGRKRGSCPVVVDHRHGIFSALPGLGTYVLANRWVLNSWVHLPARTYLRRTDVAERSAFEPDSFAISFYHRGRSQIYDPVDSNFR
jgi:hypothetical protein